MTPARRAEIRDNLCIQPPYSESVCNCCVDAAELLTALDAVTAERDAANEIAAESNAVCVCGCLALDHESYGEDGEACEHDDHECFRTSKASYAVIHALRCKLATAEQERDRLRAVVVLERRTDGD